MHTSTTRRTFLGLAAVSAAPLILPPRLLGQGAPSARINVGMIGCGRQAMGCNLTPFLADPRTQVTAVCDVDAWRLAGAKAFVENYYGGRTPSGTWKGCTAYHDFRELLANKDIDAVMISTPDHWHAAMAILAARAGKDVCCEKPLNLSVREGRLVADAMKRHGRVFRTDSEFRSQSTYHRACELVRNGRIGALRTIRTGCPVESFKDESAPARPVPEGLDYDLWLGPAPQAPYTVNRVHPTKDIVGRPGWMRIRDYCDGMICNWGTHLNDIAQWGNNTDETGPVEVEASGAYHKGVLWNVLESFKARYRYANGVELFYEMGHPHVRFEGDKGWVQVDAQNKGLYAASGVSASSEEILKSVIRPDETHLLKQSEKTNFIDCVVSRQRTLADAEIGHRTTTVCHLAHIAIQLGGAKLAWDPARERFDSEAANRLLSRPYYRDGWNPEKL